MPKLGSSDLLKLNGGVVVEFPWLKTGLGTFADTSSYMLYGLLGSSYNDKEYDRKKAIIIKRLDFDGVELTENLLVKTYSVYEVMTEDNRMMYLSSKNILSVLDGEE